MIFRRGLAPLWLLISTKDSTKLRRSAASDHLRKPQSNNTS